MEPIVSTHAPGVSRTSSSRAFLIRCGLICAIGLTAVILAASIPPIPQDTNYHQFADQRTMFGIAHCLNVVSNAPFVIVGLLGVIWVMRPKARRLFVFVWEQVAFAVIFAFVAATGFGSWYYHAQPENYTLFWDRLPLTVVFMTFFALVVAERLGPWLGPWLWPVLVACGVFGVTYWHWSESQGMGDLRWYALVQFLPMLLIPILLLAFPARYYRTGSLFAILGWYALAKVLEMTDFQIYTATGVVSGHTLKHLVAALGALWIVPLVKRQSMGVPQKVCQSTGPAEH